MGRPKGSVNKQLNDENMSEETQEEVKDVEQYDSSRIAQLEETISQLTRLVRGGGSPVVTKRVQEHTCHCLFIEDPEGVKKPQMVLDFKRTWEKPVDGNNVLFALAVVTEDGETKKDVIVELNKTLNEGRRYYAQIIAQKANGIPVKYKVDRDSSVNYVEDIDDEDQKIIPQGNVTRPMSVKAIDPDPVETRKKGRAFGDKTIELTSTVVEYEITIKFTEGVFEGKEMTVSANAINI